MQTPLLETLTELVEPILEDTDLFLVEIEVKGNDSNQQIGIYVDNHDGGVNIDQCAEVSKKLGFIIESQELITGKYTLNVSSPGLDRPLKDRRQYQKNVGRKASVKFEEEGKMKKLKGTFSELTQTGVVLVTEKKEQKEISWESLTEIKILPAF
ncbi:MAG: ribosome maturation factor RimP [Balneolales bacterium]|nr:ribosome maturation factor RimP [Balneolales bacterium]